MFSTPLASTPIVRPPAAKRPAMGRRVDAAGQAADDRQPGPGEAAGQPLRLPQPILRAHDACRRCPRPGRPAASVSPRTNSTPGGSWNLAEHPRIARVGLDEDVDAVAAAEGEFLFDVDGLVRRRGSFPSAWARRPATSRNSLRAAASTARAEPNVRRSALPRPRSDALDQHQPQGVDQLVVGRLGGTGVSASAITFLQSR